MIDFTQMISAFEIGSLLSGMIVMGAIMTLPRLVRAWVSFVKDVVSDDPGDRFKSKNKFYANGH